MAQSFYPGPGLVGRNVEEPNSTARKVWASYIIARCAAATIIERSMQTKSYTTNTCPKIRDEATKTFLSFR